MLISNTILLIGVSLAERLVYWLSVPALVALGAGVVHLWRYAKRTDALSAEMARLLRVLGVLLIVALGARSVVRNMDWSSNRALFEQDVQTYPQSAELNEDVANELLWDVRVIQEKRSRQDIRPLLERADAHLAKALEIYREDPDAMQLRGRTLGMLGDREGALRYLQAASEAGPLNSISRELLFALRDETGQATARLTELREQVSTRPADGAVRREYGELLLQRGEDQAALAELEQAVRLAPQDSDAWRLLGDACVVRDERERAIAAYRRAIALAPNDWRTHANLVTLLVAHEPEEALRQAQEAQRLNPDSVVTQRQLAEALASNHRPAEALAVYRRLAGQVPADDPARRAIEGRIEDLERGRP